MQEDHTPDGTGQETKAEKFNRTSKALKRSRQETHGNCHTSMWSYRWRNERTGHTVRPRRSRIDKMCAEPRSRRLPCMESANGKEMGMFILQMFNPQHKLTRCKETERCGPEQWPQTNLITALNQLRYSQ